MKELRAQERVFLALALDSLRAGRLDAFLRQSMEAFKLAEIRRIVQRNMKKEEACVQANQ